MKSRSLKLAYILTIFFLVHVFMCGPSHAQDAHYWTLQDGTRAELLGGTVVGSIKDLSSTFYNPGAIWIKRHGLLQQAQADTRIRFSHRWEGRIKRRLTPRELFIAKRAGNTETGKAQACRQETQYLYSRG